MYPIITLWWWRISMTGLWLILFIIVFAIMSYYFSKKNKIQFRKLFYWLPIPIILTYLLGAYIHFVLSKGQLFPRSINDILQILSPYNFRFHFVGIISGFVISLIFFLNTIKFKEEKLRRIDTIAISICIAIIPLWLMLLLGDHFIGIPNDARWVTTFRPDISRRALLGPVLPVGIYLSLAWCIATAIHIWLSYYFNKRKFWYITLASLLFLINIVLMFSHTPKYWPIKIAATMSIDISAYLSFVIIMICLQQFLLQKE